MVSLTLNLGLESVSIILVVDGALVTIGLNQGVVSGNGVSISLLGLFMDVAGVSIVNSVGELVVGRSVMFILVVSLLISTVIIVQDVDGSNMVVCVLVVVQNISVLVFQSQGGHDGHGEEKDDFEGHSTLGLTLS